MAIELRLRIGLAEGGDGAACAIEASIDNGPFILLPPRTGNLSELGSLERNAWAYGQWLGNWLFTDSGLRGELEFARGQSKGAVRVRLEIGEECADLGALLWERTLYSRGGESIALAADEEIFFSRLLPVPQRAARVGRGAFRLGLLIASPTGLPKGEGNGPREIPVQQEIDSLMGAWAPLIRTGQLRVQVVARMGTQDEGVTLERLQKLAADCDGIHIICHGGYTEDKNEASLLLEDAQGGMKIEPEAAVVQALESERLKLVFLQACESAQRRKDGDVWSGLGAKIARQVPGVVAMQDRILMKEARVFAERFYSSLLEHGEVDRAVNAGRRAIRRPAGSSWAIPVLYLDTRERIWEADPFLGTIHALARRWERKREVKSPFPVEVVRARDWEAAIEEEDSSGARTPVMEALNAMLAGPARVCALVGNFGRAKSAQLYRAYVDIANRMAQEENSKVHPPLFLRLQDFDGWDRSPRAAVAQAAYRLLLKEEIPGTVDAARIEEQLLAPMTLLLDADDVVDGRVRQAAFEYLREILESVEGTKLILVSDPDVFVTAQKQEPTLFRDAEVFNVQLLSPSGLFQFLNSKEMGEKGAALYRQVAGANLFDVASVPWLLGYLISAPNFARSRAAALRRITESKLAEKCEPAYHRLLSQGLGQIAMTMQKDKRKQMSFSEAHGILREVGERRDVEPEVLRRELLKSEMLVRTEDDSVRFAYPGFQSYWCARHIEENRESLRRRLGDITASLGRLNRAKFWEDTLVILAGILQEPGVLIGSILAGSSLGEGEQIHIACRAIHEARQAGKEVPEPLLRQVSASLIRQTLPGPTTEYFRRARAVRSLGLLRYPGSAPHLLRLVGEKVRKKRKSGEAVYDYSGIRKEAIAALQAMQAEAEEAALLLRNNSEEKRHAEALLLLLKSWRDEDEEAIYRVSLTEESVAPVAFLLLGFRGGKANLEFLIKRLVAPETSEDSQWAICDALLQYDPREIFKVAFSAMKAIPSLEHHCIYLLGKLGQGGKGSEAVQYLEKVIGDKDSKKRGMALRSLAQMGIEDYREVCHVLADGNFKERVEGLGEVETDRESREKLVRYALESLKSIGNHESLKVLSGQSWATAQPAWSDSLVDAYLETSEEIYWRLTRGMEKDVLEDFERRKANAN